MNAVSEISSVKRRGARPKLVPLCNFAQVKWGLLIRGSEIPLRAPSVKRKGPPFFELHEESESCNICEAEVVPLCNFTSVGGCINFITLPRLLHSTQSNQAADW